MTEVSLPGIEWGQQGSTSASIAGAVYDPTSHKLYILGLWTQPEIADRLYVFSVNDGSGTNPPFDFALSPASSSLKVMQSNSITNTITSTLSTGTTQNVSFSASGLPTGATASFSPTSCNPTCTTTMTIQTLASTPVGIGTITVTGTGGGATQTITFNLDVNYRGDINNDGIVNSIDWSIMNAHWFTNNAQSDINHDGIVNSIDFSILNSNWFKGG